MRSEHLTGWIAALFLAACSSDGAGAPSADGAAGAEPAEAATGPTDGAPAIDDHASPLDAAVDPGQDGSGQNDGSLGSGSCSGAFRPSELLFADPNENVNSLSPTGDELELFYVQE